MLGNVFRLGRTRLRDVMVPRERVVAIDRGIHSDALLDLIRESGFTRIPVYDGAFDNVIGILHTKDLFQVYADRRVVILEDAIRDAIFFPSDLSLVNALRRFRRGRGHLAIVRDEGGPVIGICTLEDILEQIVGDIEDEHD
jgi:CBS domain containing-hemolysin-like protein